MSKTKLDLSLSRAMIEQGHPIQAGTNQAEQCWVLSQGKGKPQCQQQRKLFLSIPNESKIKIGVDAKFMYFVKL